MTPNGQNSTYGTIILRTTCTHMLQQADRNKSSQSHLGRVCHYPNVEECTVPLRVLAEACTMHNECDGTLVRVTRRYRVTEELRSSYRTLRNRYVEFRFCPSLILCQILLITKMLACVLCVTLSYLILSTKSKNKEICQFHNCRY